MTFFNFKKKQKGTIKSSVKVNDIFVVNSQIVSSYNDGTGDGPYSVTMYFLAKCINNEYYELFSGRKLEKENTCRNFDTPYIVTTEPLTKYLKNPNQSTIDTQALFDFITLKNVEHRFY